MLKEIQNVVVDTNVLLEGNSKFWKVITGKAKQTESFLSNPFLIDKEVKICVLQIVLEELDGLKKNFTDNVGYYQRKTIQKIYLSLENIKFLQDDKENISNRFTQINQDNIILNSILEKQTKIENESFILYTNDIQLLLKQKMYNVQTITDIEKIDIDKVKNNVLYLNLDADLSKEKMDYINELLTNKTCDSNFLNIKKGYTLIESKSSNLYIPVKNTCDNNKINIIDITNSFHHNKRTKKIMPKNNEQQIFLDALMDDNIKIITSLSKSGTGKTLLQLYAQIQLLSLPENLRKYNKIIYVVNPSTSQSKHKELGFLPGTRHEKILPFMQGILDNLNYLFNDEIPEEYNLELVDKTNSFEIRPINHIRGSSIAKSLVILDEVQNLTGLEIKTVFSRVQDSCKFILLGDVNQIDEHISQDFTGIVRLISHMNKHTEKLPWLNIQLKESIRSKYLEALSDYFDDVFDE